MLVLAADRKLRTDSKFFAAFRRNGQHNCIPLIVHRAHSPEPANAMAERPHEPFPNCAGTKELPGFAARSRLRLSEEFPADKPAGLPQTCDETRSPSGKY